jgi:site-specific recombinase XerD
MELGESPSRALVPTGSGGGVVLPALIVAAGERASRRFLEFFTADIRNPNTRRAYAHAASNFCAWCEERGIPLDRLEPVMIGAYVEDLGLRIAAPSVKQHLAAIRKLFDYLVVGQVLPFNPAAPVKGPKHIVKVGKTPVLQPEEARALLDAIDTSSLIGARDRALIGVMTYSFARVGAVVGMQVKDYYTQGKRSWFRLHEKGSKYHVVPAHHTAVEYMDAYLQAAGIAEEPKTPLFRAAYRRTGTLTERGMATGDVLGMIKRRARKVGLPADICCHTFRATGITAFLANGGELSTAQKIAAHESPKTTALYDRTGQELTLDEIERIRI